MQLIAGYNKRSATRVTDKDGLRRLIARTCLLAGIGSALMPLLTHVAAGYDDGMAHAIGAYGGFIVGIIGMVNPDIQGAGGSANTEKHET